MIDKSALDRALKKTGVKMKWVSEKTGIPMQTLSELRNKRLKRSLYLWEAEKISGALGVEIAELGDSFCPEVSETLISKDGGVANERTAKDFSI